jgi:dihydrofolate reductase
MSFYVCRQNSPEDAMPKVYANMSVSLDGFVAEPSDRAGSLFDWYHNGPVAVHMPGSHQSGKVWLSAASAPVLQRRLDDLGALIAGRRLFDFTEGWGGEHPGGAPVFVVSHRPADFDSPFTFVPDGVASAIEQAKVVAGEKDVVIASAGIVQQALNEGLLDELSIDLVPVLFGEGVKLFGDLVNGHIELDDPIVVQGDRVTHMTYRVLR